MGGRGVHGYESPWKFNIKVGVDREVFVMGEGTTELVSN